MSAPCSWALPLLRSSPRKRGTSLSVSERGPGSRLRGNERSRGRSGRSDQSEWLLRRDALRGEEGFELDRLAADGGNQVAGRHRLPVRALGVERLGDDDDVVARFPGGGRGGGVGWGSTGPVESGGA